MKRLISAAAVRPVLALAACAALAGPLAGCGTNAPNLSFLKGHKPNKSQASPGERVSVIAFDEKVTPADALKGVDFALPEPQPVTAWPLPGGTSQQSVEHAAAAPAFEIAWRRSIGDGSNRKRQITAPPVAVDGKIFTLDGEATVRAFDAQSGAEVWRANLNPHDKRDPLAFGGGLAVDSGKLYAVSGYRSVEALDAATGKRLWRTRVDSPIHAAPTVSNGRLYAVDVDNLVMCFDAATGAQVWSHQAISEPARILKASSPAVEGDAVVTPFSSGELVALRAANGNELWTEVLSHTSRTNALSEIRDIAGRPVIFRGEVYAASHSGVFEKVALNGGAKIWDLPVASIDAPWPAGDVVYIVDLAGQLTAVNRDSGQAYWVVDLNKGRGHKEGGFMGIGKKRIVKPVWTGPVLASNRLVLVDDEGLAIGLNPKTGALEKTIKLGSPAYLSPIAYGDKLFVVTDKGQLVAIR